MCLIKNHAMNAYGGGEESLQTFLISAPDKVELPASHSGFITHEKDSPVPAGYEYGWTLLTVWWIWSKIKYHPCREWHRS
jgi:hypothetical protein